VTHHWFHSLTFLRLSLGAGARTGPALAIIRLLSRERGVLARAALPQELDLRGTREPKGSSISVDRKIFDLEDSFVLLEVDRT